MSRLQNKIDSVEALLDEFEESLMEKSSCLDISSSYYIPLDYLRLSLIIRPEEECESAEIHSMIKQLAGKHLVNRPVDRFRLLTKDIGDKHYFAALEISYRPLESFK